MADVAAQSSAELTAHAGDLADRRDELRALVDELDKRLAAALFAGESVGDLKRELDAAQQALEDVERAVQGSATAIAAARQAEAAERRREDVAAYNEAIRRARKSIKRLLNAAEVIPDAARAATGDVDDARELWSTLFAGDPASAPARCPAEPGKFLRDALSNLVDAAYGYQTSAGRAAQARERLASLCEGADLPEAD